MSNVERIAAWNELLTTAGLDPHAVPADAKRAIHDAVLKFARASGWRPPADGSQPTAAERSARSREEHDATTADMVMPFGRDKGKRLVDLDVRSLRWWEGVFRRDIDDPEKARYAEKARGQLEMVRARLRALGEAADHGG
jgi:hypothetical protein